MRNGMRKMYLLIGKYLYWDIFVLMYAFCKTDPFKISNGKKKQKNNPDLYLAIISQHDIHNSWIYDTKYRKYFPSPPNDIAQINTERKKAHHWMLSDHSIH